MKGAAANASAAAEEDTAPGGATWALRPGDPLGTGRRVVRLLALGRKTEVYLVWDERRRATVVAKLLRPDRVTRKLTKLKREAELLMRLSHPALVRGLDTALDADPPHLILEHVEGRSLRELMRKGPLPPAAVASITAQAAGVLHYLETEGLVHLDVKAHNVLLVTHDDRHWVEPGPEPPTRRERGGGARRVATGEADPEVKLIDLGGVKRIGDPTAALAREVPEHRAGPIEVAPAASVWLLGMNMWRALTGGAEPPREPDSEAGELDGRGGHRRASQALPSTTPTGMAELVAATVSADPAQRPTIEALAVGLEPFARVDEPPERPARPARRWARLRR